MNKKFLVSILAVFTAFSITGCGADSSEPETTEEPETTVSAEPEIQIDAVWVHEPNLELDGTYILKESENYIESNNEFSEKSRIPLINEYNGYPQEWIVPESVHPSPNSIIVKKDDLFGIYDYEGNELYPISISLITTPNPKTDTFVTLIDADCPIKYHQPRGVFYYSTSPSLDLSSNPSQVFSEDFTETTETTLGGFSEPAFGYYVYNGTIMVLDYGGLVPAALYYPGTRMIVPNLKVADFNWDNIYSDINGFSCITPSGEVLYTVQGYPYNFVNGYFALDTSTDNISGVHNFSTSNQIINAETGEPLNAEIYEEIKFFEDGYCPVKKNGKWGFIDENGNEVTDFIWDDASTLYQGKTYVSVNGVYGILDLTASLQNAEKLTSDNIYGIIRNVN